MQSIKVKVNFKSIIISQYSFKYLEFTLMEKNTIFLSIGAAASRSGMAASALRFYESKGLIESSRGPGNQRRYHRAMLRRIAIIRVAQNLGLSLAEISAALEKLPAKRTPTRKDWTRLSATWSKQLDQRISDLQNLRDRLNGCIGCGCLSMQRCSLYNANDEVATQGGGPRFLIDNPKN
ncbi:MAG: MerR family redox-sensitive transcriptional activator SoxR [Gammaproteobacteria bacterium]